MATREHMANARDTLAGHEEDRREATADAANVPWAPAGIVYLHGTGLVADDGDADSWGGDGPAEFDDDAPSNPAPSLLRRAIPLLWAAALTVAALQHAGEVERRAALQEPSSAELDMQDRAQREIRAAWRSVGSLAAVAERTPAVGVAAEKPILAPVEEKPTAIVPEKKPAATTVEEKPVDAIVVARSEPVVAQAQRATAEDTPTDRQKTEHTLVEPITEVARAATSTGTAEGPAKEAERPAKDEAAEAMAANGSQEGAKPDVARTLPSPPSTGEATKTDQNARITTSRASRHRMARAEPARAKHVRVSSSKYVPFDGHTPRYFTIERPSRNSP